jgi:hypothetical protein
MRKSNTAKLLAKWEARKQEVERIAAQALQTGMYAMYKLACEEQEQAQQKITLYTKRLLAEQV